ncbi:MAG: hypothetical protein LW825_03495, partial [Candidatus Jidaibacter sp.]|nr:hypothetical protein [Candidatus Jidaibacter sp.]
TVGERNSYFAYKKHVFTDIDVMSTAREEGLKEGMAQGIAKGIAKGIAEGEKAKALEVARKMLSKDGDANMISEFTGLSIEEIRNLNAN